MRVVCPYAGEVAEPTRAALLEQAPHTEFVDVGGSEVAYWELMCSLWAANEDFTLVEHDVIIAPGTVAVLEACPSPWCSCPSEDHQGGWQAAYLQCVRFRRELIRDNPALVESVPPAGRSWVWLDSRILPRIQSPVCVHDDLRTDHPSRAADTFEERMMRGFRHVAAHSQWPMSEFEARVNYANFCELLDRPD